MIELRTNCGWEELVHKPLLCHYSTYYEAAIDGGFQEANYGHFNLGLNKVCAEWFVRWFYSGQLYLLDATCPYIEELFQLCVFADEKDILALRRDVMTTIMKEDRGYIEFDYVALATDSLPPSAPLYRYMVEW